MPTRTAGRTHAQSVDAFLSALEHPLKPVVLALREAVLALDASVGEAVKWNAPSFHTTEHFATMHLRDPTFVQLILHLGARKRALPKPAIDDPLGLLTWLGEDRATLKFASTGHLAHQRDALQAVLRQWMSFV